MTIRRPLGVALGLGLLGCTPRVGSDVGTKEHGPAVSGPAVIVERRDPVACTARTPAGAAALVPSAAQWLLRANPRELMRSAVWSLFAADLATDPDWLEVEGVFLGCNESLDRIEQLIVGFDERGEFVVVLGGTGLGRPDTARCVIMAIQAQAGDEQIAEVIPLADSDVSIINFTDGRAYLFGADVLAIATTKWQDEVGRLGNCQGVPATDALVVMLARLDLDAPLWVAGRLTPELAQMLELFVSDAGWVSAVAASVHVDDGMRLDLDAWTESPSAAASVAKGVRGLMDAMARELPALADVVARVAIGTSGPTVQVRANVSAAELREALSAARAQP